MADIGPENENGFPDTVLSASYIPLLCLILISENRVGACLFCGEDQIPVQHKKSEYLMTGSCLCLTVL